MVGLSEAELDRRRKFITGSDAAAIFDRSPYMNRRDVWLEKRHGTTATRMKEHMEIGLRFEGVLVDWCADTLDQAVVDRASFNECHEHGVPLSCTLDGRLHPSGDIVEAKTTGMIDQWDKGDDGNFEPPDHVLMQVHHTMIVTGATRAQVPVLIGHFGLLFDVLPVQRNDELCASMIEGYQAFWGMVQDGEEPTHVAPHMDVVKRIIRKPNKVVEVSSEVVDNVIAARTLSNEAKGARETAEAELLGALGDAEGGKTADGRRKITYLQYERAGYSVEATSYRQLRIR